MPRESAIEGQHPSPERGIPRADYIPTLDGWRAVAITCVLITHGVTAGWAKSGEVGVDIFFGISGFLICSRLLAEQHRTGRISLTSFYMRRAFRILPPFYVYLICLAILTGLGILAIESREWLYCLAFLRNYMAPQGQVWTTHIWSLSVEEHFYLLWPAVLIALGARRARAWIPGVVALITIWRTVDSRFMLVGKLLPGHFSHFRTDVRLDGLLMGCWLALILDLPGLRDRLTRALSTWAWLVLLAAFVAVLARRPPLAMTWIALLVPFLIVGTALRPTGLPGRILEARPLRWVGQLSYSIYLWQQLFFFTGASGRVGLRSWPWNLVATLACASLSFYLVEQPMIRLGRTLAKRAKGRGRVLAAQQA